MVPSDLLEHCRLCLVKECVSVNIFENEAEIRQLYYKIVATLPVQISRQDDKLPKKICKNCNLKVDELYQFWSITANSQKTLLQWLHEAEQTTALTKIKCEFDADVPGGATAAGGGSIRMKVEPEEHSSDDERGDGVGDFDDYRDDSDTMMDSENLVPENMVNVSLKDGDGETGAQHQERKPKKLPGLNSKKKKNSSSRELSDTEAIEPKPSKYIKVECPICGKVLSRKSKLVSHMRSFHSSLATVGSPFGELLKKAKSRVPVECSYCGKILSRKDKLTRHIASVHSGKEYPCEQCDRKFTNGYKLKQHQLTHMQKDTSISIDVISEIKKFKCDQCDYATKDKYNLGTHIKRRHTKEYSVLCTQCGFGCYTNRELEEHQILIHGAEPYHCKYCDKTFTKRMNVKTHERMKHENHKPYECYICNKILVSRGRLNEHLNQVHLAQRFECKLCHKTIVSEKTFKKHMALHSDAKPFVCNICGKDFKLKYYVNLHMRTHTRIRPTFECDVCHQVFPTDFRTKHMLVHDVEKSHLCFVCGAGFVNDAGLKVHMRKHQ